MNFSASKFARAGVIVAVLAAIGSFSALLSPRWGGAGTTFATPADNVSSTLGLKYTAGSGTVTLATGYGATLAAKLSAASYPAVSSSAPLRFTLTAASQSHRSKTAVYLATSLSGDVLGGVTVETGSTDQNFAAGDLFQVLVAGRSLYDVQRAINNVESGTTAIPLKDSGGQVVNVKALGAQGNAKTATATAISSGVATITVSGYVANAADIGKTIVVPGAGAAGVDLVTTIAAVATNQMTVTASPSTNVASATITYGTDDTTAIASAIASLPANGGTLFFPPGNFLFTTITLDSSQAVRVSGTIGSSTIGKSTLSTQLTCVGTSSASAISCRSSRGLTLQNMAIRWASPQFTGYLIDARKLDPGSDTAMLTLDGLSLGSSASAAATSCIGLVVLDGSHNIVVKSVDFQGGAYGVIGKLSQGITSAGGYAISVLITGQCNFSNQLTAAIRNADQAWKISGNVFEPLSSGAAGAYTHDSGVLASGLTFDGNWIGDDNAAVSGSWIKTAASGFVATGNYMMVGALTTGIQFDANTCAGIHITGNTFFGNAGSSTAISFGATTGHQGITLAPNNFTSVVTPVFGAPTGAITQVASTGAFSLDTPTITGTATISAANVTTLTSSATITSAQVAVTSGSGNLLTTAQAANENGGTNGWHANANCTPAISAVAFWPSSPTHSTAMTALANGQVSMFSDVPYAAVTPGVFYSAFAYFLAGSTSRPCEVDITWLTSGSVVISTTAGAQVSDNSSSWTQVTVSGTAPATAAFARVLVRSGGGGSNNPVLGETHYIDGAQLAAGSSLIWNLPGVTPSLQLGPTAIQQTATNGGVALAANGTGATQINVAGGTGGVQFGDGAGHVISAMDAAGSFSTSVAQTTVAGSTGGSATFTQPLRGASWKKVVIYCNALNGSASYTFPTPFTVTPSVFGSNDVPASVVSAHSTTSVTVIGGIATGFICLEGY